MRCIIFYLSILFVLSSCVRVKISPQERAYLPYTGNDVLIFKYNKTSAFIDTVYVYDILYVYHTGPVPILKDYQDIELCLFIPQFEHDSNFKRPLDYYPRFMNARHNVNFTLPLSKKAKLYSMTYSFEQFDSLPTQTFVVNNDRYDDVVLINTSSSYTNERDNVIIKCYWSKKYGYIRFDMKDGTYYELINKYMDEKTCGELRNRPKWTDH